MQIKPFNNSSLLKYIAINYIIILFIWISFFPQPLQEKYHVYTNISLIVIFLIIFARNRFTLFRPYDYSLLVFLLAISINIFFAQKKNIALKTYLDLVIPMFCIYYIISESITSNKQFDDLSKAICILSILVAFGGLMDSLLGVNYLYEYFMPNPYYQRYKLTGFLRAISTQFNSPPLGTYLIAGLPFNLSLMRQGKLFFKILGCIGTTLGSTVIILTLSRGVFLGFVTMVLLILYINKKWHLLFIFSIVFCLFILICSYIHNPLNRLGLKQLSFYGSTATFSDFRYQRIIMALRMFKDHPFVGLGFQHFRIAFNKYYSGTRIMPYELMIADNMYFTLLAETGIIGFIGFLIFIFSIIRKAWSKITMFDYKSRNRQQLLMVLSAFIGLLVNLVGYELFYWNNQYICFCILAGCTNALLRNKDV